MFFVKRCRFTDVYCLFQQVCVSGGNIGDTNRAESWTTINRGPVASYLSNK